MKKYWLLALVIVFIQSSCGFTELVAQTATATPTDTATPSATFTPTNTSTSTATLTLTPSNTPTPEDTPTPSNTPTKTLTFTPEYTATPTATFTPEGAVATGNTLANCRWGPGTAYLESGVAFKEGMIAVVDGKNSNMEGLWYWIQIQDVSYHCWVHSSTADLNVDASSIPYMPVNLPTNDSVMPPTKVKAGRSGNQVTISWTPPPDAVDQGFLLELGICSGGFLLNAAYKTEVTLINITDDENCTGDSFGTIRTFNKLGYSEEVPIPWPNE